MSRKKFRFRGCSQDEIVEALLAHPDIDVNIENLHHHTALILSSGNGNVRVMDLLIADPRVDPNLVVSNYSPLTSGDV